MSKYFITQHILLLIGYIYYSEPATSLDLSKKMFLLALQTRPPQLLLPPRWKKIYDLLNFFSVEERDDSRTEPNLVNKGGVLVIQTLNHEFFAWQHEICVQGRCPAKTKHLWIAFRVFSL